MGELRERTIQSLRERRQNLLEGNINSIPSTFKRFSNDFIGVEQGTYYCVTSTTKGGKSQFASFTFIFQPLLYAFLHKEQLRVKIFYFALEETPERVLQRFMSYLLYTMSGGKIRRSPKDLRSSKNDKPIEENVLELLGSEEYTELLDFFEENVIFSSTTNPTGIYKECKRYVEDNGTSHYKIVKYTTDLGEDKESNVFDHYESNDPKEYRIVFIDHIGLIETERGMTLKQSMDKLSEYLAKYLRNRYGMTPVVIQQQNFDNESNDNYVSGRIRPSAQGLGDSKYIARDCNILLGLFSPFKYELEDYKKYNINIFRDNIRFLEVLVNRDGEMGGLCPLFFDGAVCDFQELPLPTDTTGINQMYKYLEYIRGEDNKSPIFFTTSSGKHKHLHRWKIFTIFARLINKFKAWQKL